MKLYAPQSWDYSNQNLDGILFFTQRIDEMLFDFTIAKYKAPVSNTHLLIREYLEVYTGESIAHYNLQFILDELKCSLRKDPVLKLKLGTEYIESTHHSLCTLPDERKVTLLSLLNSTWGDTKYLEWCIEYAKEVLRNANSKEKIDLMLRCLIPELIGSGYSSSFIYIYNKEFFSLKKNSGYEKACEFLNRFDVKKRLYTVYLACENNIEVFRSILNSKLGINFDADENFSKYKHDPEQTIIYIKDIKALDESGAALLAYKKLNFFLRFYSALSNKKPLAFSNKSMVIQEDRKKTSFVTFQPNGFSAIQDLEDHEVPKFTTEIINGIVEKGSNVYNHLKRVLDLHNTSLSTSDYNSAYLNLWSILEILSLSHNDKINSVIEVLVPLLQKDYFYNCFKDLGNKLEVALGKAAFKSFLDRVTEFDEDIDKVACFVLSPNLKDLRQEMLRALVKFPVLRYRIHYFSELSYDSTQLINILNFYTERTTWHIRRIYRLRNSIAHSGIIPDNIKSVGDHLHSYVDTLLYEVVFNLASDKGYRTVENVLLDMILSTNKLLSSLSKKDVEEKSLIQTLLHSSFTI